jgi:hypothetical protein
MATTTNYSWTTPDDTDLVKDGASAIRTLGSSVDTTVKALNPETTLGDIAYRSSTANTNTRLGIGTTGQVLSVVGGVPAWASAGGGLALVQRSSFSNVAGTSTTFDGVFTSTYASYIVVIENLGSATAADDLQFVFRISGSDGTGHYGNTMQNAYNAATWTNTSSANVGQITMYVDNASTANPITGQIFVSNVGTNLYTSMNGYVFGSSGAAYNLFYGYNNSATTYTGFRLKSASTNITGTVAVYGMAKS